MLVDRGKLSLCRFDEGVMAETITVTEAAADEGITRNAVWVAIKRGRLQATKRGRDWHIERAEWERYKREVRRVGAIDSQIDSQQEVATGGDSSEIARQEEE